MSCLKLLCWLLAYAANPYLNQYKVPQKSQALKEGRLCGWVNGGGRASQMPARAQEKTSGNEHWLKARSQRTVWQMSGKTGLDWETSKHQESLSPYKGTNTSGPGGRYKRRERSGWRGLGTPSHEETHIRAVVWFSWLKIPGLTTVTITPSEIY